MTILKLFKFTGIQCLLVGVALTLHFQSTAQQFAKEAVHADLDYLKSSLETTHFDLYAYTTKEAFVANFLSVKNQITSDSLTLQEVINLFQKVVAKANNAHTRIAFADYTQPYMAYFQSGGSVFPLEVAIENGKVLVRKNWSTNPAIAIGAELRAINKMPIAEVLHKIYPQISAERAYFKNALLESFTLPRYYWQVFSTQQDFDVDILQNGSIATHKLAAIKALDDYEMKRSDILKNDWELKQLPNATTYLRPGQFSGKLETYQRFIDSAFVAINTKKVENLIIDLRNHSGGDDPFGDYLVSYIADRPFKWTSKFQLKSSALLKEHVRKNQDTTTAYAKSILMHKNGEIYDYDFGYYDPQPESKRFKGKVFVMVNRHSYSQSTVTAAQIQDYGFAKIVGEETAEHPNLFASIFSYKLPNTGIGVDIPKGKIQRLKSSDNNKGVIPDILIRDHLIDEHDEILEGLIELLNNN